MITIVIRQKGLDQLPAKLRKFRSAIINAVPDMLRLIGEQVVGQARDKHLSGPRPDNLGVVTGDLRRSVNYEVKGNRVVIGSNLPYAPVHELGATILPRNEKFLVFKTIDGEFLRARQVTIPPRPFLSPSLEESKPEIHSIVDRITQQLLRDSLG